MDVKEAKEILDGCERQELRDHAFGDMEITWTRAGFEIAYGFGGRLCGVTMIGGDSFEGTEAIGLVSCGTLTQAERNDESGPPDFVPGRIMPGLTREAVKQDLMKQNFFRDRKTNGFRH